MKLKLSTLKKFREFDRKNDPFEFFGISSKDKINSLILGIKNNGLENPLELWIFGLKAMLIQGNHRLVALEQLGITNIEVKIKFKFRLKGEMKNRKSRFVNIFN